MYSFLILLSYITNISFYIIVLYHFITKGFDDYNTFPPCGNPRTNYINNYNLLELFEPHHFK